MPGSYYAIEIARHGGGLEYTPLYATLAKGGPILPSLTGATSATTITAVGTQVKRRTCLWVTLSRGRLDLPERLRIR